MKKKVKKLFLLRETLVDLSPYFLKHVHGAQADQCWGVTHFDLTNPGSETWITDTCIFPTDLCP